MGAFNADWQCTTTLAIARRLSIFTTPSGWTPPAARYWRGRVHHCKHYRRDLCIKPWYLRDAMREVLQTHAMNVGISYEWGLL